MDKKTKLVLIVVIIGLIFVGFMIWGAIGSSKAESIGTTCDFGIGDDGSALCWK